VEKRLFLFVVLSIVIWGGYLGLQFYLNPPKPKPAVEKVEQDKVDNKQADEAVAAKEKAKPEKPVEVPEPPASISNVARRRVTLGSLDPNSPYTLLVTFDNRGGAIERIEFNNKYHDLDDRSGYLGQLAPTDAQGGGVEVNVVGPGTPAALAGLLAGDVITAVNGKPLRTARDLVAYLEKETKSKDVIALDVKRGTDATLTVNATLIRRPLELIRPEDNSGAMAVDPANPGDFDPKVGPPSYRLTLSRLGKTAIATGEQEITKLPSLHQAHWDVKIDEQSQTVVFTTQLSTEQVSAAGGNSSLSLTKTFRLATKNEQDATKAYHLDYGVAIKNTGDQPQSIAYRQEGPNGLPLEGWWYLNKVHPGWKGAGARDIRDYSNYNKTHFVGNPLLVSEAASSVKKGNPPTYDLLGATDDRKFQYMAVDAQYFACALLPGEVLKGAAAGAKPPEFAVDSAFAIPLNQIKDKKWAKTTNVTFFLDSEEREIGPGKEMAHDYVIFAGPKDDETLAHYKLEPLIEYGWFGPVVKVLKGVLDFLYYYVTGNGNYGISIILLTIVVRLCLLPFSIRQAKSAAVMQAMAPEMAKIKEKYANDMEKQATAQRELMAKYGVNPMGGCLLMFAQLPIFIGLYRCLATDIDLREAALIPGIQWASNLAGPDELFRWKQYLWRDLGDEAHGWLGPYFNILPLFTIALFMIQQKLFTPPAMNEEQKMQQKIMNFMTIFMGVMFYKVPAGLCIYFITSSLWGIAERKFITKPNPGAAPVPAVPEKPDSGGGVGAVKKPAAAPSFVEKLFGLADAQLKESKSVSPRKKAKK
jgi:YidC/Oxa1 family membrane protein insertase